MSGQVIPFVAESDPPDNLPAVAGAAPEQSELARLAERALQHAMLARPGVELSDASDNLHHYLPVHAGQALRGAELDAWIDRAENDHALRMVGRGVAYLLKQQELPGNAFSGWLRDNGIKHQRAYECIGVAKMYARLDADVVPRVGQLPARKQISLATLPAGVIERLSDEGDLDTLAGLSLDKFRASLSALRNMEARADRLEAMVHAQNAKLDHYTAADTGGRLPPSVEACRVEGTACGLTGQSAVGRLEELARLLVGAMDLPADSAQRRTLLREGLAPVHAALSMIRGAAHAALTDLDDALGHYLPSGDTGVLLSLDEIRAATQTFELQFTAARLARVDAPRPAKAGRGKRGR
jgi:hypothetical protein